MTATSHIDRQDFIMRTFGCDAAVASAILHHASERHYEPRTIIIQQGNDAAHVFLMVQGQARAFLYSMDGRAVLLHEFGPGDIFGGLDSAAQEPEVAAVDDVTAATFRTMDFVSLAERHGCVGLTLSRMLMARLRSTTERIYQRTTLSSFGRVYAELLRMAKMGDGRLIQPVPIFSELAGRVHTTRETVSRAISALERRGLINREGDAMTILAPQRLEELVV